MSILGIGLCLRGPGAASRATLGLAVALLGLAGCRDDEEGDGSGDSTAGTTADTTEGPVTSTGLDGSTTAATGASSSGSTTDGGETSSSGSTTDESTTGGEACGDGVAVPGTICFQPFVAIDTQPTGALALGDLDGNGTLDLLGGHPTAFSVRLGLGDGSFDAPLDVATPSGVLGLAVGDFDGDGVLDVAASNTGDDSVGLHLGNGDGSFAAPQTIMLVVDADPRGLAVADFDDDGALDLAVANYGSDTVSVLAGQGDGTLAVGDTLGVGTSPIDVAAVALSGDATIDLAVLSFGAGSISVFLGEPGGFSPEQAFTTGVAPRALVAADFDDDGALDLATPNQANDNLAVLLGDGLGNLADAEFFVLGAGPREAGAGDLDGDGLPDLAVALEGADAVGLLRTAMPDALSLLPEDPLPTLVRPVAIAVADLDGNGVDDIITGSIEEGGGIAVLLADP